MNLLSKMVIAILFLTSIAPVFGQGGSGREPSSPRSTAPSKKRTAPRSTSVPNTRTTNSTSVTSTPAKPVVNESKPEPKPTYTSAILTAMPPERNAVKSDVGLHTKYSPIIAMSPGDPKQLASGGDDGEIRIWNVDTKESRVLGKHKYGIHAIVFTPDGRSIISTSADHTVRLWNVATGEVVLLAEDKNLEGYDLAIDPYGREIALTGSSTELVTINIAARKMTTIANTDTSIRDIAYSPTGGYLAYAVGADREKGLPSAINVLGLASGWKKVLAAPGKQSVVSIAFSADGAYIAGTANFSAGFGNGCDGDITGIYLWNIASGGMRTITESEKGQGCRYSQHGNVEISRDGKLMAVIYKDSVGLWDISTGEILKYAHANKTVPIAEPRFAFRNVGVFTIPIVDISFSGDSRRLAYANNEGKIRLWLLYGKP